MKLRDYYFKRESTIKDSDTEIINIDIKDPISYISVEYEATNGATSCLDHELHDDVSKIEVVDGSDVLCSLSMSQLKALNFYELGRFPHELLSEAAGAKQEEKVVIHFGRYPDDMNYYLRPTDFRNPQIKLTHALTISATAGFATGTGRITVMGRVIEEGAGEYGGFMMSKERYSWTSAGSGDEEIELYRDYPYRLILLMALLSTYTPQEIISKIKMTCDADKYIPFELYTEDIVDYCKNTYGLTQMVKTILSADAGTALLDIYDIRKASLRPLATDQLPNLYGVDAEQITHDLYDMSSPATPAVQTTAKDLEVFAEGLSPFATVAMPLPRSEKAIDWFDPTKYGAVKLICTQATANAACKVFTQQLRK